MNADTPLPTNINSNHLSSRFANLERKIADLDERLRIVESQRPNGQSLDETTEKILEFLRANPQMKFNCGTIAANLGITTLKVSSRIRSLQNRGLVESTKIEGGSWIHWIKSEMVGPANAV